MDVLQWVQIGVLIAVGYLVIRRANFNLRYLLLSLFAIGGLWWLFTQLGYQ